MHHHFMFALVDGRRELRETASDDNVGALEEGGDDIRRRIASVA